MCSPRRWSHAARERDLELVLPTDVERGAWSSVTGKVDGHDVAVGEPRLRSCRGPFLCGPRRVRRRADLDGALDGLRPRGR